MQVTKESTINLQHIQLFLLQVFILDLHLCIGLLVVRSLQSLNECVARGLSSANKMQSRQQLASLTREDGEQWLEVGC